VKLSTFLRKFIVIQRTEKMAADKRMKLIEDRVALVEKSLARFSEHLKLLETLESRMSECERKCDVKISVDGISEVSKQEISKINEDLLSRVAVCQLTTDEKISNLDVRITEVGDKAEALGVEFRELKLEFPTPAETRPASIGPVNDATVSKRNNRNRKSCVELLKTTKESVLVLGDSLARGVGDKLRSQSGKVFEQKTRGGAKIESVINEIEKLEDDNKRHLVVIAGTNNLESDDISDMLDKYGRLIDNAKKVKQRQITVVGIVKRYDLGSSFETKRIMLNMKLHEMCQKKQIEYLDFDPERRQLGRDMLHLNDDGQNELAGKIFKHCLSFLC
jgi:hypothetical protein